MKLEKLLVMNLLRKCKKTSKFNQGFANTEYLAASFLDMDWHTLTTTELQDTNSFEEKSLEKIGLIDEIISRYRTTYFSTYSLIHIQQVIIVIYGLLYLTLMHLLLSKIQEMYLMKI